MPQYKGTRYVSMRKVMKAQPPALEKEFLDKMDPQEREKYLSAPAVRWFPVESLPEKGEMFQTAAEVMFPNDTLGLQKIGRLNAHASLTGIYRIFVSIPSIDFVMRRVAQLWGSYQDTGTVVVENKDEDHLDFVVKDFPSMREDFREYLVGYIQGVMDLAGATNAVVTRDDSNPQAWRWIIHWSIK